MDTGIDPETWWEQDDRTLATALELKAQAAKGSETTRDDDGMVTGG